MLCAQLGSLDSYVRHMHHRRCGVAPPLYGRCGFQPHRIAFLQTVHSSVHPSGYTQLVISRKRAGSPS